MAVVLGTRVKVFDGISQFSARDAAIELDDNNTFSLVKLDPATGGRSEVIFDRVPLSELRVGGSQAMLTFTHNGVRKRVDFSFASRAVGGFGIVGMIAQASMIKQTAIGQWLQALRAGGATMKYLSQGRIILISLGIVVVIIVVIVVVAVASVAASGGVG